MSKYTDYLNSHPNIDYKHFLKVCAWNAAPLKTYVPQDLAPVEAKIELNIDKQNQELDAAMDKLQELEAMTPAQQTQLRDTEFDAIEDAHWSKINELESLITVYGAILSDLCRWNPQQAEMKTLKAFAIKELTSNMPDLSKYAVSPAEPTVTSFVENLRRSYNTNINTLTREITTKSKENIAANDYIDLLLREVAAAPDAESGAAPASLL